MLAAGDAVQCHAVLDPIDRRLADVDWARVGDELDQRGFVVVFRDLNERQLDHFGALRLELRAPLAALFARTGDNDASAVEPPGRGKTHSLCRLR